MTSSQYYNDKYDKKVFKCFDWKNFLSQYYKDIPSSYKSF